MHFFKVSNRWDFVAGSSFDAKVVQCSVQFNRIFSRGGGSRASPGVFERIQRIIWQSSHGHPRAPWKAGHRHIWMDREVDAPVKAVRLD